MEPSLLQTYRVMGTLDDAIREHLELKRREGISEDELKEKEAEAFGPGRAPAPPAPPEPPAAAVPGPVGDEQEPARTPSLEEELLEPDEVLPEESLEPNGTLPAGESEAARRTHELAIGETDAADLAPGEAEPWEDDHEPESEDLLEETPDFLEETPEHDRLWFEQKPPKDFDFD
jgi:hypothetical protein